MMATRDLRSALLHYVNSDPDGIAVEVASAGPALSRSRLLTTALWAAALLQERGVAQHDRYLIALDNVLEFPIWFWAGQLIGAIPVPVAPLSVQRRSDSARCSLLRISALSRSKVVVATGEALALLSEEPTSVAVINASGPLDSHSSDRALSVPSVSVQPDHLALLQFSSGSTSSPKGCALEHGAILENAQAAGRCYKSRPGDTFYNWLPQFHDLGLMGGVIAPVVLGMRAILQRTKTFVLDPLSWLRGLSASGPVHTSAPNFGLQLVARRLSTAREAKFQLADVKSIICGGEPIHPKTAQAFLEAMLPFGLRSAAFRPSYGMAEATVLIASAEGLTVRASRTVAAKSVEQETMSNGGSFGYVCLGKPVRNTQLRIRGSDGRQAEDGIVGDIEVSTASMMKGYFEQPDATAKVLKDGWLSTGDLGFMVDGELHCVGRTKDVLIVGGRNLLASDVDRAISEALSLDVSRLACFGSFNTGTENLCVAIESREADFGKVAAAVNRACFVTFGVTPHDVIAVAIGALPKTTSGKIRRAALADLHSRGVLHRAESSRQQLGMPSIALER